MAVLPQPQPEPQPQFQTYASPTPTPNYAQNPDSDQVARLQRELARERQIMEQEQAASASGFDNSLPGQRQRRNTNIGHRFGASRGPLVLKASLRQGDVNTRVGLAHMATRHSVAPHFMYAPLPAQVTRSIGDWDAARPRTLPP